MAKKKKKGLDFEIELEMPPNVHPKKINPKGDPRPRAKPKKKKRRLMKKKGMKIEVEGGYLE